MSQQRRFPTHNPYQRIAELESKLNRANRHIERLRQENQQLKRQLSKAQEKDRDQPTLLIREIPVSPPAKTSPRKRRRSAQYGRSGQRNAAGDFFRQKIWAKPQVRLAAVVMGAATVLIVSLSVISSAIGWVNRSFFQPFNAKSGATAQEVIKSPLLPPPYPSNQAAALPMIPPESSQLLNLTYNVTAPANLKPSQHLQTIVDQMVNMATKKGRSTNVLSITLINLKTNEVANYQEKELRYPASVLKLFWLVYLYAEIAQGIFPDENVFAVDLYKMIQQSSNEAASRIVDVTTGTKSGKELKDEAYQQWRQRRLHLSEFFQKAGYGGLVISQKTYSTLPQPEGRDGQLWNDPQQPVRNKISSEHAARLMYEIVTGKAISPEYSGKIAQWLARDLSPEGLADKTRYGGFNPIDGFLAQPLPPDVDFASKAGLSSSGRHEVAYVRTRDGKTAYVLAILASDPSYASDGDIFPKMSRFVFESLSGRKES